MAAEIEAGFGVNRIPLDRLAIRGYGGVGILAIFGGDTWSA